MQKHSQDKLTVFLSSKMGNQATAAAVAAPAPVRLEPQWSTHHSHLATAGGTFFGLYYVQRGSKDCKITPKTNSPCSTRVELPFCRVWEIHKITALPLVVRCISWCHLEKPCRLLFQLEPSNCFAKRCCIEALHLRKGLEDGFGCGSAFALSLGISPCATVTDPAR